LNKFEVFQKNRKVLLTVAANQIRFEEPLEKSMLGSDAEKSPKIEEVGRFK